MMTLYLLIGKKKETMEEFTLTRPYVMKKYKEPSEKENLNKTL